MMFGIYFSHKFIKLMKNNVGFLFCIIQHIKILVLMLLKNLMLIFFDLQNIDQEDMVQFLYQYSMILFLLYPQPFHQHYNSNLLLHKADNFLRDQNLSIFLRDHYHRYILGFLIFQTQQYVSIIYHILIAYIEQHKDFQGMVYLEYHLI